MEINCSASGRTICKDDAATKEETLRNYLAASPRLRFADLSGVNFREVPGLRRTDLYKCKLDDVTIDWDNRQLLAEILRREAGDSYERQRFAGFVATADGWCWERILDAAQDDPALDWALETFAAWATPGDDAPECVASRKKS